MPSTYYVYHGSASEADPYDTWAKAAHSLQALDTAKTFASGDIIYIASDHVDPTTASGNLTITGPASGGPTLIISANRTTTLYEASSTNQVNTTAGAYQLVFNGAFGAYGLCVAAGERIQLRADSDTHISAHNCTFKLAANKDIYLNTVNDRCVLINCTIDLTADGTTARSAAVLTGAAASYAEVKGLTFVNAGYRTGAIFASNATCAVEGCDFSGFTNGTLCEIGASCGGVFANCKTASTWGGVYIASAGPGIYYNCGPSDSPTALLIVDILATLTSTTSIYRTGGAAVEGVATSWLVATNSNCSEANPFYTPWIYGKLSSTGSKTFDLYITNDTADFTDAEVWLEVEYLKDADGAQWTLITDQRATITTTAAAQTDDTSSTWNGTGPSFTYKQSLVVTATVNETGQYRARVAVGKASIASSAYFYVDPKVTVS